MLNAVGSVPPDVAVALFAPNICLFVLYKLTLCHVLVDGRCVTAVTGPCQFSFDES